MIKLQCDSCQNLDVPQQGFKLEYCIDMAQWY